MKKHIVFFLSSLLLISCNTKKNDKTDMFTGKDGEVKLIVIHPGHFHAALLQKNKIDRVSGNVFVYAPSGNELKQYVSSIENFNSRDENPTSWQLMIYEENDFLKKATDEKRGNVVVLAGNNKEKTRYISQSIHAGLNVISDKPMAINKRDFEQLLQAYVEAEEKGVYLYDMMTERYDILNIIEKELINSPELFGNLQTGSEDAPAISMESVHHFYKEVSGRPLIRPVWYYDVEQQGEGIADVTTHLIDLVHWKCFPEQAIDYKTDIKMLDAAHWPTLLSLNDFSRSTQVDTFPDFLCKYIKNSALEVNANGTIDYQVKGITVHLKVRWNYQAPPNGGDTFTSTIKGTKSSLITIQNKEQGFVKQLYVKRADGVSVDEFKTNLENAIHSIRQKYPFVSLQDAGDKMLVAIPAENRSAHEVHFGHVAQSFFDFLVNRDMPQWEITNTLAKYYITTAAVEMANQKR